MSLSNTAEPPSVERGNNLTVTIGSPHAAPPTARLPNDTGESFLDQVLPGKRPRW